MKKIILTGFFSVLISLAAFGQKFAYVDSDYILSNIPDYAKATQEIDDLSVKWQKEVELKFQEIDQLYKKYQADQPLLTAEMKTKRENEIVQKEKEAKDLQKKRFGTDGDLFKKRQELIRPIQDKIYNAIEKRAADKNFTFVFDRNDNVGIMYADPKVDISDDVLKDMGYNAGKKKTLEIKPTVEKGTSTKSVNYQSR